MPKKISQKSEKHDYAKVCRHWAISDHWPLIDAVNLVLKQPPRLLQKNKLNADVVLRQKILHEIAMNCAGESLPIVNGRTPTDQYRVRPREFIAWAEKIMTVPQELKEALDNVGQELGKQDAPKEFSPKQRHRERCRGIAALLWQQNPSLTKAQVASRDELLYLGCEGKQYAQATIEDWIKSENPNKKGGRPRKET